ncbi:MAG: response regulator transcription factor [Spartobacteria bacterium]|nr:response regulator transcription factor [Spartobacteria bacterium]
MKILIVDDHAVVRRGLIQMLCDEFPDLQYAEADNGQAALDKVWAEPWDVVVLDVTLPGRSGLDILKDIKHHTPDTPVLILSMHPEDQFAVRALKAGAAGYMTKETAPEELINAVNKVMQGGKYVSPSLAEKLVNDLDVGGRPLHDALSDREYEVLRLIASGKTISEIAGDLSLSVKTISTYRQRILQKMKLRTNAELTHYAFQHGLAE